MYHVIVLLSHIVVCLQRKRTWNFKNFSTEFYAHPKFFESSDMSTRLCKSCGVIHGKPWDRHCVNAIGPKDTEDGGENIQNKDNEGKNRKENPEHIDPALTLYSELLTTVKGMNSRFASYDKRLTSIAAMVETSRRAPTSTVSTPPAEEEPVFCTAPETQVNTPRDASAGRPVKRITRTKNRHASEPSGTPQAKVIRLDTGASNKRAMDHQPVAAKSTSDPPTQTQHTIGRPVANPVPNVSHMQ